MAELSSGEPAPAFDLPSGTGESISLASLRGKSVVLYFYPKDDTSGCTAEAIDFSGLKADFVRANAVVIGISPDSAKSHAKFAKKHELSVDLIADEEKSVAEAYGVWVEKSMYGRKYMGVERSTYLIGPDGTLQQIWRNVKVPGHAKAVLDKVESLRRA